MKDIKSGFIVGVTGRVGVGKTSFSRYCSENYGFKVVDLDLIGHEVLLLDDVKRDILNVFGNQVFDDGIVSRKKLGRIVFFDHVSLKRLNRIVHPVIRDKCIGMLNNLSSNVILVGALLCEIGLQGLCDSIVVIDVDDITLRERLKERVKILDSQDSREKFLAKGDVILVNTFDRIFFNRIDCLITDRFGAYIKKE